ncbi:DUF397 domain-containing protein [Streptomyces sp. TRM76323]|uniref:DUF397 domain-containing protein n=1 Tax=Streptomyces tamarix TaxID=3078565 RepID=A0ABU3QGS1_9ACTN|nr:DUF397 domain-containing protein [Streptomyces tamarix]MDT9681574.1 DUF397 domain-containing protein [Streptomyces tamarix]
MTLKPSGSHANLGWIKSSYSTADGPSCVEVAWVKSSYSGADTPSCVEVATAPGRILVRDSKNPAGPRLALAPATWAAFLPYASGN